jgi:hypothetical protein
VGRYRGPVSRAGIAAYRYCGPVSGPVSRAAARAPSPPTLLSAPGTAPSINAATAADPEPLLPALDWIDFEQLVVDDTIKAQLRPFFEPPITNP